MIEQTLVLIKPDGVMRSLIGEIISRYEKAGLKVVRLKMLTAPQDKVLKHYPSDEDYLVSLGKKSASSGDQIDNFLEQGQKIVNWLKAFIASGKIVAMVLQGEDAITLCREITGYTDPASADKGTIRGDLGEDSILRANREARPVYNLVHASGNLKEAQAEIKLWFGKVGDLGVEPSTSTSRK